MYYCLMSGTISLYYWKGKQLVGFSDMILQLKQLTLCWMVWHFQMGFSYLETRPSSSLLRPPTAGIGLSYSNFVPCKTVNSYAVKNFVEHFKGISPRPTYTVKFPGLVTPILLFIHKCQITFKNKICFLLLHSLKTSR